MATIRNKGGDSEPAWEARVRMKGYPTKTGEARTVPLSSRTRKAFEYLRKLHPDAEDVFAVPKERAILSFRAACKTANITGLTFLDLGHEAATRLSKKLHDGKRREVFHGGPTTASR